MHQHRFLIAVALACGMISTSTAQSTAYPWRSGAQANQPASRLIQRNNPVLVSFGQQEPGLQDTQPSVSDVPQDPGIQPVPQPPIVSGDQAVAQSAEPGLATASNANPVSNYCDSNCNSGWCNLGCERKLFGETRRGMEVGGWANVGYHNRDNPLFNNRKDEANLHQMWLYLKNEARSDSYDWNIGYRTDLVYGIDGQDLQAFGNSPTGAPTGWDNGWDYGSYGWAMPQAYIQMANCMWDVKVGKFASPFGYESIGAADNFFYSHSYTRYYTDPFTMTGVLGERKTARGSVLLGATAGWETGFENNSGGDLILGLRRSVNEFIKTSLTVSVGDTGYRKSGMMTSGVTEVQLTDKVDYVLQIDSLNLDVNQEFGVVQYLMREVNPCLSLGARLEWWKSDRFYGGPTSSTYDFTMGANYRANANITIRPEVRFDWGALAVDNGQAIFGIDAVMTF